MLAPFALPALRGKGARMRADAGLLLLLALTGVAVFQSLVYSAAQHHRGQRRAAQFLDAAVHAAVLLGHRARARFAAPGRRHAAVARGHPGDPVAREAGALLELELHKGDAWILLAMPVWGVYSVLLKRRPANLGGVEFLS